MDKPTSMSIKDYLIRVMSVRTNTPEKIIEAVVNHQFMGAEEAMHKPGIHSVEISGFGKFLFNTKKAIKKYEKAFSKKELFQKKVDGNQISPINNRGYETKLTNTIKQIEDLKPKIDGIRSDNRGVEKQTPPCAGYEACDRAYFGEEDGDL